MTTTPDGPRFRAHWETALPRAEHAPLEDLLVRAFPSLPPGTTWIGARPELRVIGWCDDGPVAHVGILRRFLRLPAAQTSVLVGDVGLVAVAPEHRGRHVGAALLTAVAATLAELDLPYGFLTCGDAVRPFYERSGWCALGDRTVHAVSVRHEIEDRRNGMLLPVHAASDELPPGPIHRDGQEI